MGLFKHPFYDEHIKNNLASLTLVEEDLSPIIVDDYFSEDYVESDPVNNICLHYISDIHLIHKIQKQFPHPKSDRKIIEYIELLAEKMVESVHKKSSSDYLLIAGDVASDFAVSEVFFRKLSTLWNPRNIVFILGNHELWDKSNDLNLIIQKYRNLFSELDMCFLHNEILFVRRYGFNNRISETDILNMSEQELSDRFLKEGFAILGGLGFSGLNEHFNASHGAYRETISSLEQDKFESAKFETVYKKVLSAVPNDKIIVFTHTPKENWTYENHNPNWIYVNGHTHQNLCYKTEEKTIYANNQVGYKSSNLSLKNFTLSARCNIYRNLPDGIHSISSADEYIMFYALNGTRMTFRRKHKELYLVKKNGIYAFFCTFDNKPNLYILDGGMPHKLDNSDINYYYQNIDVYAYILKKPYTKYYEKLQSISKFVKSFGGNGTIHGSIIDIDFYNHIYLNPFDGKITPYFAPYGIVDKYIYDNLPALLSSNCKQLYSNYRKMIAEGNSSNIIVKDFEKGLIELPEYVPETHIYKASSIMRKMQYLQELNVIRNWDDKLIEKYRYEMLNP